MKAIINNQEFENMGWSVYENVGTLYIMTENSIKDIINLIGDNQPIEIYDDNNILIGLWQNNGLKSASSETIRDQQRLTFNFDVSILTSNAEAVINGNIDESIDGIIELANIIDTLDTTITEQQDVITQVQTDNLANQDKIFTLESRLNAIPSDLINRLDAIQTSYNALADRVATLENWRNGS